MSAADKVADMLGLLVMKPRTAIELMELVGFSRDAVVKWLNRWAAEGLVRVDIRGGPPTGGLGPRPHLYTWVGADRSGEKTTAVSIERLGLLKGHDASQWWFKELEEVVSVSPNIERRRSLTVLRNLLISIEKL